MGAMEYVKVHRAADVDVPHGTFVDVPFTSALYDPHGYWDSSTKLIVPTGKGGVPFLFGCWTFTSDMPNPDMSIQVFVNGEAVLGSPHNYYHEETLDNDPGYGNGQIGALPTVHVLEDGDEVTMSLWQDSVSNANATMQFSLSTLWMVRLALP